MRNLRGHNRVSHPKQVPQQISTDVGQANQNRVIVELVLRHIVNVRGRRQVGGRPPLARLAQFSRDDRLPGGDRRCLDCPTGLSNKASTFDGSGSPSNIAVPVFAEPTVGTERDRAVIKVLELFRRKSAQTEPKALSGPTCLPSRRRRPPFLHQLDSTPKRCVHAVRGARLSRPIHINSHVSLVIHVTP